eukprot:5812538-Amphidinium_carterae.1
MGSLYEIDAIIHIGRQPPRHLKDFWSIIIDTGAAVSVCPMTFCEHLALAVKTMPESARRQYVTGEGLTIARWKEVTLVIGALTMQIRFIVANSTLAIEQLHPHGAHLHAAAMVLPWFHKPNEIKLDETINSRFNPSKPTTLIVGEVEDISQQANIPKQLRQPPQPTKQEQEQHHITHMPFRFWYPICVKAKGQSVHHRRGGLKEQSLIQLD